MNLRLSKQTAALVRPMATDLRSVRRRALLVAGVLGLALLGLVWRAYQVAVVHHDFYAEQGNRQQLRTYKVRASRGDIVDRRHIALAVTDRVFKIVINPRLIQAQGLADEVMAKVLELFPDEDPTYLRDELGRDKAYRALRMQLDDRQAEEILDAEIPGVRLERIPDRVYPRKLLASHVLGRVSAQGRGNLGIEYGLDEVLRGRDAMSPAYIARGKRLLVDGFPDPGVSRGHTIVLTIDSAIQAMVEEEINALVAQWQPVSASVVVLDPRNGEVLAMASRPTFDPNHKIERLEQTVNQAVQRDFEPGSTMKAITVAAALEQGVVRQDESFFCEKGRWQYTEDHAIRDTHHDGWLSVAEILAVSSNICTTKIYETLDKQNLYKWVKRFHFGERPPIELPGATTGVLDPWEKWSDIQGANISFGQGMTASPLQVASAFAALANDGVYHSPTIVRRVLDVDGNEVPREQREPERLVRIATARTVMQMLENVVHSEMGTGKNARIEGYRVAGKTSTAQKASKKGGYAEDEYFASFVGAVPAGKPRIVILVSVDNPQGEHFGNQVAAPTFAKIGARVMEHLGVERQDGTRPTPDPIALMTDNTRLVDGFTPLQDVEPDLPGQRPIAVGGGLPDFTGLTLAEALDAAEEAEVLLHAVGTGIAVMQDAPPGPVNTGSRITVFFEPPA
jgi:cell division protein FtsI (penicillin-binding protein 3)